MNLPNGIDRRHTDPSASRDAPYLLSCHEKTILVRINIRTMKTSVTSSFYIDMAPYGILSKGSNRIVDTTFLLGSQSGAQI